MSLKSYEVLERRWRENFETLAKEDKEAKEKGTLVGRYIREPFADGHAYYRIIKEYAKTVLIKVVTNIGDDWKIPYWGDSATIDKGYAMSNVRGRDALEELFSKKKEVAK